MEIISMVISCVSLLLGVFTFCFYDRKIKTQDAKINEYQIQRFEKEEEENKKAQVRANIIKGDKGSRILKIYNSGKSDAYNVRIDFLSGMKGFLCIDNVFPYEKLMPKDGTSVNIQLYIDAPEKTKIKLLWDDDYQKNNENTQILTLI